MKRTRSSKAASAQVPSIKKAKPTKAKVEQEDVPSNMATFKVRVVYCGGWGYKSKFLKLKKDLERHFPDNNFEIIGEKTAKRTGWFEVVIENGTTENLVHSKKDGEGQVDTPEKLNKIVQAIEDTLALAEKKAAVEAN